MRSLVARDTRGTPCMMYTADGQYGKLIFQNLKLWQMSKKIN